MFDFLQKKPRQENKKIRSTQFFIEDLIEILRGKGLNNDQVKYYLDQALNADLDQDLQIDCFTIKKQNEGYTITNKQLF